MGKKVPAGTPEDDRARIADIVRNVLTKKR